MRRRTGPYESERIDRLAGSPTGLRRQNLSLVKSPCQQSPPRQRHRNEQVGLGENLLPSFRNPPPEKPPGVMAIVKLEPVNEHPHQPVEVGDRPGAVIVRRIRNGGRRKRGSPGIDGQRQPEPVAQRRADEIDLLPA